MTSLIEALDTLSIGENGAPQYTWNRGSIPSAFEKDLVGLDFMSVRQSRFADISSCAPVREYWRLVNDYVSDINCTKYLFAFLFRLRDVEGKGEYGLFHCMLPAWDAHARDSKRIDIPSMIMRGLDMLFQEENSQHPFGSWKDIKYILNAIRRLGDVNKSYICNYILDKAAYEGNKEKSLIHRWLPREKSNKFGWQASLIATRMYSDVSKKAALTMYRKKIAECNKELRTTQVYQCAGEWSNIDFKKDVTSSTMFLQKKAFNCDGTNKNASQQEDRIKCRDNYVSYVNACVSGKEKMKSKRVGIDVLTKQAYILNGHGRENKPNDNVEIDAINTAWRDQNDANPADLSNWIALVDTSASMTWENEPLYAAIAIGFRIAERSSLGKRVMTFSASPAWVNMSEKTNLMEMMAELRKYDYSIGGSTNILSAFKKIADACVEKDLHPSSVESLVFCILIFATTIYPQENNTQLTSNY